MHYLGFEFLLMKGVALPALEKLLLSATGLISLSLCAVADSVVINPKTIVD